MADTGTLEVQTQTHGRVAASEVSDAVRRVSSLLRMASEPVLFARVRLTMHADPAMQHPAIAQINVEADLLDYDFHLFRERSTGEDSVIYRTPDGYRLALAHRRTGRLGSVDPSITVSQVPAAHLTVTEAEDRLEAFRQPFLFFVNDQTGRGNLIYHRYDGHYGLIEPAD